MTVTIKKTDADLVIPPSIRRKAGIKAGDQLEFRVSGGIISIIPKLPFADDEYTLEQRRVVDAELAEARKGPYYGPFDSADDMIAHMEADLKKNELPPNLNAGLDESELREERPGLDRVRPARRPKSFLQASFATTAGYFPPVTACQEVR